MKKKWGSVLTIILALLMTGSTFAEYYYVNVRAENTAETFEESASGNDAVMLLADDLTGGITEDLEESVSGNDAIMLLANDLTESITEGPEEGRQEDSLDVSITINGKDISEVTTIHQDDAIEITINWIISDDELGDESGEGRQIIKEIYLTPTENVNIPDMDARPLRDTNNREIGYVTVKDNVVTMVINDKDFLLYEKGRRAKGLIEGTIDAGDTPPETGKKVHVQIGNYVNDDFYWDNNEGNSWLNISKSAGDLSFKKENGDENGKWVQTYIVEISNYGGQSTITEIEDIPGSKLGNWHLVSAQSNLGDTALTNTDQSLSLKEILQGLTLKANEKITLIYTMEVEDNGQADFVFKETGDSLKNTLSGKWEDNKGQSHDFSQQVSMNVTKPSVTKVIAAGSTDDEQTWEITINLGDAAEAGMTLADVVREINEVPGNGLIYDGEKLEASDFKETSEGSGIYKATIKTKLTDEYKDSESTVVKNKVKITTEYWQGEISSNEASYTTTGNGTSASISKEAVSYNETTGRIQWKVILHDLPADAENVKVSDWVGEGPWGKTWGDHRLLNTLIVDDKTVIKEGEVTEDGRDVIQTKQSWDATISYTTLGEVYFLNDFIKANVGKGITLIYETEVANKTAMKDVWFYNTAKLEYTTKGTTKYPSTSAEYQNEAATNDALTKTGVADDDEETITYTLTIDMDKVSVDAESGGAIVITDKLVQGNGLVYVEGSAVIDDMIGDWSLKNESRASYYDPQDKVFWRDYTGDADMRNRSYPVSKYSTTVTAQYEKNENEITFTIPAENLAIIKAYRDYVEKEDHYSPAYTLVLTYKMKVEDVIEFIKNGQTEEYVNQANGTYNRQSLNRSDHPATTTNTLTPEDVINKTGKFIEENENHEHNTVVFTVDVNPGARDLSEGSLTAIDKLSKDLAYDLTTIHVYEMDGSIARSELSQGLGDEEYSFVYDPFNNSLTFTLPDAKHLQITYVAKANVFRESDDPEKKITIENSFELQGYSSSNMKDSMSFQTAAVADKWLALSEKGSIQLYKYWNNGSGMQAVIGSVFEVYGTKTGTNGLLEVDKNNPINSGQKYEVVAQTQPATDLYGGVTINNLEYNTYYALVEVEGGQGINGELMAVQEEPYFFMIEGSDVTMDDVPANCTKFVGGGLVYYPNEEQTDTGFIKITKTWSEKDTNKLSSWEDIKDSLQFVIKNKNERVIKTFSGADLKEGDGGKYESEEFEVPLGTYTVEETNTSLTNFEVTATYEITVNDTKTNEIKINQLGDSAIVAYYNEYKYTGPFTVKISKTDLNGTKELAGAKLEVRDSEDALIEGWTSVEGASHEVELLPGTYTLTEVSAPQGYKTAQPITFKVADNGNVTLVSGQNGSVNDNTTVIMRDEPLDVEVDKYKLTDTEKLPDAELALYDRADLDDNYKLQDGKKALATWESKAGEVWSIGDHLCAGQGKTYVLIETSAPKGYGYSKKIEFQIDADGKIFNVKNVAGGDLLPTTKGTQGNQIIMRDAPIEISLHKIDHQGNPVGNAEISVYQAEDMDGNEPKANVAPVYSGTTPEGGILSFGTELTANADGTPKEYVIVETKTPDGYQTASPVHIWVQSDGTVVDKAGTIITSINMIDVPDDAEVGTLVITKTISGELTPETVSGGITFFVKGVEGAAASSEEYKDGKTFSMGYFDLAGDNEYTMTLYPMELGIYEVWETVEDPDGVKHTTKYTITVNDETSEIEEEMDPDEHAEFTLEEKGDVVTIAYENNYQYIKGTILLRKSFSSSDDALQWDDIKNKLTFLVYEGDVVEGKEPVATVYGNYAGWTKVAGEENLWEYGLEIKVGTYTVVEVCDSIDDYVSVTTYTMDNKSDTGTKVENVTVTEGAVTTVAYINTYVSPVYISKKAIAGTEEIDRPASLTVYGTEDDGTPFSDNWFTGKEPHKLQLKPGQYTLTENTAPQGYAKAEDIEFIIDDKGDIIIPSNQANLLDGRTVTMWDAPLSLKLNKMALVTNESGTVLSGEDKVGEPLEGAEIEIYEVKADKSREFMTSWRSTGTNTPHDFGPDLYAGRDYVLVERQAPQGYLIAKEIAFTIADDGTVKVADVQENNYYQGSDGVIYMLDKESDKPLASLLLTKSIKGIDYADVDGLLSFKVECVSGEGGDYEKTFTIGDQGYDGFTWDGEKYIRLVANLAPGSYRVTESWTDSDSIVCQERSYTIKITREDKEYATSSPVKDSNNTTGQFSTPDFSLEHGNTAEVNFENTYENIYEAKGTLIITKTIVGDFTKEEAERTLTFTVTENSTKEKKTYALKDDFSYNSETKKWTKELTLPAGEYTVEEFVKTADGKTCTTTYTVTGGTSRKDIVGTKVENVVLEKGGTTTVAYTNTYNTNTNTGNSNTNTSNSNTSTGNSNTNSTNDGGYNKNANNDNNGDGDSSLVAGAVQTVTDTVPRTGDNAPIGVWLLLLVFSTAGAVVGGYMLRRRWKKG